MWMYLVLLYILQKTSSIRLVSIQVPERVSVGQGVNMSCVYDLEGDKLYNVKWLWDGVEFFRYVPSDRPPGYFFPFKGIQVDLERSGNGTVYIQDVKTNTSGVFGCEISADAPSFQTLGAEKMMAVEEMNEGQSNGANGKPSLTISISVMIILLLVFFEKLRRFSSEVFYVCWNASAATGSAHIYSKPQQTVTVHDITRQNNGGSVCSPQDVTWTKH